MRLASSAKINGHFLEPGDAARVVKAIDLGRAFEAFRLGGEEGSSQAYTREARGSHSVRLSIEIHEDLFILRGVDRHDKVFKKP